jgi:HK97 family phage major capsid protein
MTKEHITNEAVSSLESLRKDYEVAKETFASKEDIKGFHEKHKATHEAIDRLEELNKKTQLEIKAKEEREQKLTKSIEAIEMELKAPKIRGEKKDIISNEMKALNKIFSTSYNKEGDELLVKYLRTNNDHDGGYLVPTEYSNNIIEKITSISPVRQVATVLNITGSEISIPKMESSAEATWIPEGKEAQPSNSTFGSEKIRLNEIVAQSVVSTRMISDSAINIEQLITTDISRQFARKEGQAFINGDGIEKPKGLLPSTTQEVLNGGVNLNADSIFKLLAKIKQGYNLAFMLNSDTLYTHVRTLKGQTNDHYLFDLGLQNGLPSTIAGKPYYIAEDMPDVAADSTPILLGDFEQAYYIVDNNENITVLRNPYKLSSSRLIEFNYYKRVGGQVVLPEALAKIKMS